MGTTIRQAREEDLDAVADLWCQLVRELNRLGKYVRGTKRNRAVMRAHLTGLRQVSQVLVLEADGILAADAAWVSARCAEIVGFVAIVANPPKLDLTYAAATISDVFVAPAWRGQGHGRALVAAAVELIRERGLHAVELSVHVDNTAARALYRAMGFAVRTEQLVLHLPDSPLAPEA